jgi:hypothetical protein
LGVKSLGILYLSDVDVSWDDQSAPLMVINLVFCSVRYTRVTFSKGQNMQRSNTYPPSNKPPQEVPMPIDPEQDPSLPEDPIRTELADTPIPSEAPNPANAPEEPVDDPFDEGNFPV